MKKHLYLLFTLWLLAWVGTSNRTLAQSGILGTTQVHPGGHLAIYNNLTFVSGYVVTPRSSLSDNISFQAGSSYSGASDASHVNGYAEKVGNTAFTFPVGNGTTLRPVGISAPASGTFSAAYFITNPASATAPTGAPFSTSALGAGVGAVSTTEYWDVNGSSPVTLTFTWNAASNLATLANNNVANLTIVGWNGSQWVALGGTATGTLSGTGTITTTAPLTPNAYSAYTFGKAGIVVAPGGVLGETTWLRPDAGTSSTTDGAALSLWTDQSSNANDAAQATAALQPIYRNNATNGINFNPVVTFDGTNDFMSLTLSKLPLGTTARTLIVSAKPVVVAGVSYFYGWGACGTATQGMGWSPDFWGGCFHDFTAPSTWAANTVNSQIGTWVGAGGAANIYAKGKLNLGPFNASFNTSSTGAATVGKDYSGNQGYFNGNMGDIIVYPFALSAAQRMQVESYLAIKYGYTMDQTTATNYLASDGTTITWNATTNSSYKNDIAGIGRDDATALSQKQSKSVNSSGLVVMGNGNTVAADNAANATTFSADKSFLVWGDNAGSIASFATTGAPGGRKTLARTWKVAETGTVGSVKVQVPDDGSTQTTKLPSETGIVYLLVSNSASFSAGATEVPMTLNGTNWEANVDLTDGQYFTFATQAPPTLVVNSPLNNSQVSLTPTISGTATAGSVVTILGPSNTTLCTTTAVSGTFACPVTLSAGPQTLTVTASNAGGTSTPATVSISAIAGLTVNASPATQTATSGQSQTASAATALSPQGGTQPLTYSTINPTTGAASTSTAHGTVSINPTTGVYTYTPTPGYSGTDAIGIKVCDSSTPPQCATSVIPVNVSLPAGIGTLDCSTAQIYGVTSGTAGSGMLKLTINVSTVGGFPVTVSGSGMSASPSPYTINATTTGVQTFYVPIAYNGSAFGATTITVGGAGTCSPNLSSVVPRTVSTSVLDLGPACSPVSAATLIK